MLNKAIKIKYIALAGFAAIFMVAFTYLSVELSSTNHFCGTTCHEMDPMYQAWQHSHHNNVDCAECHEGDDLMGLAEAKMEGMRETYLHITGDYETPIKMKNPTKINCYKCHQDKIKTDTEVAFERKDPHTMKHFENNINCITCHSGVVHNEEANKDLPSRDRCYTCHLDNMTKLANTTVVIEGGVKP